MLKSLLERTREIDIEQIFTILQDNSLPPDDMLPDTGVGLSWERMLSPVFITSPHYGTRSSSVIIVSYSGQVTFAERSYVQHPSERPTYTTRQFVFHMSDSPNGLPGNG